MDIWTRSSVLGELLKSFTVRQENASKNPIPCNNTILVWGLFLMCQSLSLFKRMGGRRHRVPHWCASTGLVFKPQLVEVLLTPGVGVAACLTVIYMVTGFFVTSYFICNPCFSTSPPYPLFPHTMHSLSLHFVFLKGYVFTSRLFIDLPAWSTNFILTPVWLITFSSLCTRGHLTNHPDKIPSRANAVNTYSIGSQ